jgi:hypothetical protein
MSGRLSLYGIPGRSRTGDYDKPGSDYSPQAQLGLYNFLAQLVDFCLVALPTQPGLAVA